MGALIEAYRKGCLVGWIAGRLIRTIVMFVALPVMTVGLGVPASLWIMSKHSRGAFPAFIGWMMGVRLGWIPAFDGPAGIPAIVFWPLTALFSLWFAWGFGRLTRAAWANALRTERLMSRYGMPPSEIV